ncbi:MAG: hypothetical protein JSU63_03880, partial [Phycisphaerales bacterium]
FFGAAARAMRDILVERARRKMTLKRRGDRHGIGQNELEPTVDMPSDEILAVDEALNNLEEHDPRKAQIVNLRYFARMTTAETAAALGISVGAVRYEWRYIRSWLVSHLKGS